MSGTAKPAMSRLVAYIGSYGAGREAGIGGITILDVSADGRELSARTRVDEPREAGYLVIAKGTGTLYAVDERKTDGRGPVSPPAAVHAFRIDAVDGELTSLGSINTLGPRPTFLSLHEPSGTLFSANHGDFQHVEQVVRTPTGEWTSRLVYDDSTVVAYQLAEDGRLVALRDVVVLEGHGPDPNTSPQNNGHAQASPHAHCAVVDPSGGYLIVCDKGCDRIHVYGTEPGLPLASTLQLPPQTGPRHLEFDERSGLAYATFEFSSEVASLRFNGTTGELTLIDRVSSVADGYRGSNEPAEIRVHPDGGWVYANNRGEDSIAWFSADASGGLRRKGQVSVAKSLHPGVAARSFAFSPDGSFMLAADRPAGLVRSYRFDAGTGALEPLATVAVAEPGFIVFLQLPWAT